jgi:hypothetical protein
VIVLICVAIAAIALLGVWRGTGNGRSVALVPVLLASAMFIAFGVPSRAISQVNVAISIGSEPPPLPAFYQPYATQPNLIWEPGYWGWSSAGFFWVPGTWVEAPHYGLLWTPGYWACRNGSYFWNPGYWGQSVGYYGGINYGYGYYGSGYRGGRWNGDRFEYNTSVTNVDTARIHDSYVDRGAYVNQNRLPRTSYNGGAHGITARPSQAQLSVAKQRHYPMTAVQIAHVAVSQNNRNYLARVNHGNPSQVSVPRPLAANNRPANFTQVKSSDHAAAQPRRAVAPVKRAASPNHAAPAVQHHAAAQHADPPAQHRAAVPSRPHTPAKPRGSPKPIDLSYWNGR